MFKKIMKIKHHLLKYCSRMCMMFYYILTRKLFTSISTILDLKREALGYIKHNTEFNWLNTDTDYDMKTLQLFITFGDLSVE